MKTRISDGASRSLTLVFAFLFILSLGIISHNAFAMGPPPGSCNNEYDGQYTNATIIAGNQTYYPLKNNLSFQMTIGQSYYLTTTIHVPSQSNQGNSLPGSLWYSSNIIGYDQNACSGTVNPNDNYTITGNYGFPGTYNPQQSQAISVYWAPNGFSYTVNWVTPSTAPSSPQNLTATVSTPSQINLNWIASSNNGGSAITGYEIDRSTNNGTTWSTLISNTDSTVTTYNDTGLSSGTTYTYRVSAINSVGTSQPSSTASATTPSIMINPYWQECCWGLLSVSGNVQNPIPGNNQIEISIFAPNGTLVLDQTQPVVDSNYLVSRSDGKGNYTVIGTYDKSLTSKILIPSWINDDPFPTIENLSEETLGSASGTIYIQGQIAHGIEGENVSVVIQDPTNSTVTSALLSSNTHALYWGNFGPFSKAGNYTITVTFPYNGATAKSNLQYSCVTTSCGATVPSAPTGLVANAVSSSQINLSWTAPSNDGGTSITEYEVERSTDGGTTWSTVSIFQPSTSGTTITYFDTELAHSTTYTYRVSAINQIGTSQPSDTASATTFNTVPSQPTGLKATAQVLQINLSWNAPSDNGGTPITGYKIERSINNGSTWLPLVSNTGSTGTTYSDTNVLPLITYTYRVSAINNVGIGNPSNTASASIASTPTLP